MQWKRIVLVEQSGPTDNFSHAFELDFLRSSRNGGCFSSLNCHCSVASPVVCVTTFHCDGTDGTGSTICLSGTVSAKISEVSHWSHTERSTARQEWGAVVAFLDAASEDWPLKDGKMLFGQSSSGAHKTHQAWLIQSTWNLEVFKDILSTVLLSLL